MKRRLKRAVLLLLAALAALLVFVGCEMGMTKEDALNGYNLKASVTYYANGGEFSSGANFQEIWYKENSKPIDLVKDNHTSGTTIKLSRANYKFLQWYHVLEEGGVNEDGTPKLVFTYNEKTKQNMYTPDKNRPVDFNAKLAKDEHWYICADWEAKLMVEAYLVSDSPIVEGDDITYYPVDSQEAQENKELSLLATYSFRNEIADIDLDWRPVKPSSDHTFVGFYHDVACTQLATGNIELGEENVVLYAKYIEGDWDIIREAKDVEDIFQSKSKDDKFFFIKDIDMAGVECNNIRIPRETNCTVLGNGFTVKNLTVSNSVKSDISLFGAVSKDAVIKDLTFENVTCNWTFQRPNTTQYYSVYFVCASVAEGADVQNVTFTGELALNIDLPKVVVDDMGTADTSDDVEVRVVLINFGNEEEGYRYTNCLFGGTSDEDYTTANPDGFKVVGDPEEFILITIKK